MVAQSDVGFSEGRSHASNHSGSTSRTKFAVLGGLFLLSIFIGQGILFIRANSQTIDEAMHLAAGYSYLATGDFRIEPQNPPFIKELLALPLFLANRLPFNPNPQQWRDANGYLIGQDLLYKSKVPADQILTWSRVPNLVLGSLLVALGGWWAYRLWGDSAALLAVALASVDPNLVAHSSLVTTDVGVSLFMFLTVYLLWEFLSSPNWSLLAATGIATGMALLCKFSGILLIPIIGLVVAGCALMNHELFAFLPARRNQNGPLNSLLQSAIVIALIFLVALLPILPIYFFQGFRPWFSGLHQFLTLSEEGLPGFLMGEHSSHGWWSYFIFSFLIKTPLGSLILIAASLIFYRAGRSLAWREALFLLAPVLIFLLSTTQAKVNIGIRHILPVYPFLFILASRLTTIRLNRTWLAPALIGTPVLLTALSSLRIAPHQLAYFNESVGGSDQGYRYLSDSNLDWGQDLKGLKAYIEKEKLPTIYLSYFGTAPPSYYGIRYQDVASKGALTAPPSDKVPDAAPRKILAISVYNLQDVSHASDPLFSWLRFREPIAKIGYSIFIYDLTNDPVGVMMVKHISALPGLASRSDQVASN
jgi:hypothetical protein